MKGLPWIILVLITAVYGYAKDAHSDLKRPIFQLDGYYWIHSNWVSDFALDETNFKDGLGWYLDHRLRLKPRLNIGKYVSVVVDVDALTGQIAGDTTQTGASFLLLPRNQINGYKQADFRQGYIQIDTPVGRIMMGQMTSEWGLGILANGGEDHKNSFWDSRYGDLVERILFATRPFEAFSKENWAKNLYLALGFDLVYRDENASLIDGDRAYQGIFALFYRTANQEYGIYTAYRHQRYKQGDMLKATAVDLFAKKAFDFKKWGLSLAFEGAGIFGSTDHVVFERAKKGVDIMGFGFVFRTNFNIKALHLNPGLEIGFASGDKDPSDGTIHSFSFDPDYHIGMILFPQIIGRMSARSVDRVLDPSLMKTPPKGYDLAATNGAITNAFYLAPKLNYKLVKGLDLNFLGIVAFAPAPLYSVYNTAANGGYPTSFRGGRSRYLGTELDAGVYYELKLYKYLRPGFLAQAGMYLPSKVMDDYKGNSLGRVYMARLGFNLGF